MDNGEDAEEASGQKDKAEGSDDVRLALLIDEATMVAVLRESELMGDADIDETIRRRLIDGLWNAAVLGAHELRWRPVRRDAFQYELHLRADALADLDRWAAHWNYDREVVIATLLSDEICKPFEVAVRERHLSHMKYSGQVQREPGRGNIYPASFHLAGYQLVFIRMLAGEITDRALVLEEALLALARQIVRGDLVLGRPVSDEAHLFARRMVDWAPRPRPDARAQSGF